jgi:hypothetical protein
MSTVAVACPSIPVLSGTVWNARLKTRTPGVHNSQVSGLAGRTLVRR